MARITSDIAFQIGRENTGADCGPKAAGKGGHAISQPCPAGTAASSGDGSRWREFCRFAARPSSSLLKHLLQVRGGKRGVAALKHLLQVRGGVQRNDGLAPTAAGDGTRTRAVPAAAPSAAPPAAVRAAVSASQSMQQIMDQYPK